jgi:serine/threonine protein kinase
MTPVMLLVRMHDTLICLCEQFLHMHNIIHGDIKPENIFIAEDSSTIDVRLGDFGTAFEVMGRNSGGSLSGSSRMTVVSSSSILTSNYHVLVWRACHALCYV